VKHGTAQGRDPASPAARSHAAATQPPVDVDENIGGERRRIIERGWQDETVAMTTKLDGSDPQLAT